MNSSALESPSFLLDLADQKLQHASAWVEVVQRCEWTGTAGVTYRSTENGTHVLEYRDTGGLLRGLFVRSRSGELFLMTDPAWRRRGVGLSLLQEGQRRGVPMNWAQQTYTRTGWAVVQRFLAAGER